MAIKMTHGRRAAVLEALTGIHLSLIAWLLSAGHYWGALGKACLLGGPLEFYYGDISALPAGLAWMNFQPRVESGQKPIGGGPIGIIQLDTCSFSRWQNISESRPVLLHSPSTFPEINPSSSRETFPEISRLTCGLILLETAISSFFRSELQISFRRCVVNNGNVSYLAVLVFQKLPVFPSRTANTLKHKTDLNSGLS